jgi:hypothetical protein
MSRFLKRLFFALATLGLGALAYALLRTESPDETVGARGTGDGGSPEPAGPSERTEARPAAPVAAPEAPAATAEPPICAGRTKSGKRCSRPAQPGSRYCWQHGGP